MNWIKSQSTARPTETDITSSKVYNYVRRNIEEIKTEEGIVFVYEELKIRKDIWDFYKEFTSNTSLKKVIGGATK